jgi:hypothetical protein
VIGFALRKVFFLFTVLTVSITFTFGQQKSISAFVSAPSVLTQGDRLLLQCNLQNNTGKEISGTAHLLLTNREKTDTLDGWFQNSVAHQYFTVAANSFEKALFPIEVPFRITNNLHWRISIEAPDFTDIIEGDVLIDSLNELPNSFFKIKQSYFKLENKKLLPIKEWDELSINDTIVCSGIITAPKNYYGELIAIQKTGGGLQFGDAKMVGLVTTNQRNYPIHFSKSNIPRSSSFSYRLVSKQAGSFSCGQTILTEKNTGKIVSTSDVVRFNINPVNN